MNLLENRVDRQRGCVYTHRERQIALTYWRPQVWSKLLAGLASILRRLFYTSNTLPLSPPHRPDCGTLLRSALIEIDTTKSETLLSREARSKKRKNFQNFDSTLHIQIGDYERNQCVCMRVCVCVIYVNASYICR